MSSFEIANRISRSSPLDSPITTFGRFASPEAIETTQVVYSGANIRACLYEAGIDPNQWSEILLFNSIGSLLDLVPNVTVLNIPRTLTDLKFASHPDD
jgi:hypothetical protein